MLMVRLQSKVMTVAEPLKETKQKHTYNEEHQLFQRSKIQKKLKMFPSVTSLTFLSVSFIGNERKWA